MTLAMKSGSMTMLPSESMVRPPSTLSFSFSAPRGPQICAVGAEVVTSRGDRQVAGSRGEAQLRIAGVGNDSSWSQQDPMPCRQCSRRRRSTASADGVASSSRR